jgi:hypothetical protein
VHIIKKEKPDDNPEPNTSGFSIFPDIHLGNIGLALKTQQKIKKIISLHPNPSSS